MTSRSSQRPQRGHIYGAEMDHVKFGRTGLRVSSLCLGTMTFGTQCDEATSADILETDKEAIAGGNLRRLLGEAEL